MTVTIEELAARVDGLVAELDQAKAALAALEEAKPPPPTTVICTNCFTEIPIEDAESYADPEQGGATRSVCVDSAACQARMPAEQQAEEATEE